MHTIIFRAKVSIIFVTAKFYTMLENRVKDLLHFDFFCNFGFAELTWHSEMKRKNKFSFCISLVFL